MKSFVIIKINILLFYILCSYFLLTEQWWIILFYINIDLKNLTNRPNANKISLNVKITEPVIFKHKNKKLECPIKIEL